MLKSPRSAGPILPTTFQGTRPVFVGDMRPSRCGRSDGVGAGGCTKAPQYQAEDHQLCHNTIPKSLACAKTVQSKCEERTHLNEVASYCTRRKRQAFYVDKRMAVGAFQAPAVLVGEQRAESAGKVVSGRALRSSRSTSALEYIDLQYSNQRLGRRWRMCVSSPIRILHLARNLMRPCSACTGI